MLTNLSGPCFGEVTYYCVDCVVDFCASCQTSHALLHAISMVKYTHYSWPPQSGVAAPVRSCSQCSADVKSRLECADCSLCLCSNCGVLDDRRKLFYKHRDQHQRLKGFIPIMPPTWNVVPPTDRQCECFKGGSLSLSHCGRCHKGRLTLTMELFPSPLCLESPFPKVPIHLPLQIYSFTY